MKKKRKKILRTVLVTCLSLFLIVMIGIGIIVNFVFTPAKITPVIQQIASEQIKGAVQISRVELTFFRTFPLFELKIDSIRITPAGDSTARPVVELESAAVSVNPVAYLFGKKIVVNRLILEKPDITIRTEADGRSTLDMFAGEPVADTLEQDTLPTSGRFNSEIDIKRIHIRDAHARIDDRLQDLYLESDSLNLSFKGSLAKRTSKVAFHLSSPRIYMREKGQVLLRDIRMDLESDLTLKQDSLLLYIDKANLKINGLALSAKGKIKADSTDRVLDTDLRFGLHTPSLAEFLNLIPPSLVKQGEKIETGGDVLLTAHIQGLYGKQDMPEISAELKINDASARYTSMKWGIDRVSADIVLFLDLMKKRPSFVEIKHLTVNVADSSTIRIKGGIDKLLTDPAIRFDVASDLNITRLTEVFPLQQGVTVRGGNKTALSGNFRIKDLENKDYGKISINGQSDFNNLLISIDGDSLAKAPDSTYLYVEMKTGTFLFGNDMIGKKKQSRDSSNLTASIDFSGLAFKDQYGKQGALKDIHLDLDSDIATDSSKITRIKSNISLGNASFENPDTLAARFSKTQIGFDLAPDERNPKYPRITLNIRTDSIDVSAPQTGTRADLSSAGIRISTAPPHEKGGRWRTRGGVDFSNLNIFSRLFPIRISLTSSELMFRRDTLTLKNTDLKIGESAMTVSGDLNNLLGTFMNRNDLGLKGNLSVRSKKIDLVPIIAAANASIANEQEDMYAAVSIETDTTAVGLFQIPPKLEMNLAVNVDSVSLDRIPIHRMDGRISMKDQVLTVSNLDAEVLGAGVRTYARYKPIGTEKAELGLELNIQKIDISQIPDFFPIVDTLMPMFRSFEGIVDLDMEALGEVSSDYVFDLSSTLATVCLKGQNLVLMDSETFKSISKMLMFKNKKRNLIDSLDVDIVAHDGQIDVIPFEATIDRYRAIIGGTQTVDTDYNIHFKYNVSIMKSPLPFKAGVDIFGTPENFDFKITKAKLKRTDFEQQSQNTDSIRRSIQRSIRK